MTDFVVWGVTASPFLLKMQSLLTYARFTWQRWPEQAPTTAGAAMALRLNRAKKQQRVRRFPSMSALGEYPSVPFYTQDQQSFYYDSSALARQLDQHSRRSAPPLVPEDPALAFVCQLIDEAFDEFGLYMVHHMRWVGSARSTRMGDRTAREFGLLGLPPLRGFIARALYRRQVRRCPYLFSVAPAGFTAAVPAERTPPSRAGFPPTHELLESAWRACLAALEDVLAEQPFVLGQRFTLADASVYGQLGMNLADPEAAELLQQLAPRVYRWLCAIDAGQHQGSDGELALNRGLRPLFDIINDTFVPLMRQNATAYARCRQDGETLFNEAAFDAGRALYDGELMGHPFRAVVKTFQVEVWRELQAAWAALDAPVRDNLAARFALDFSD